MRLRRRAEPRRARGERRRGGTGSGGGLSSSRDQLAALLSDPVEDVVEGAAELLSVEVEVEAEVDGAGEEDELVAPDRLSVL